MRSAPPAVIWTAPAGSSPRRAVATGPTTDGSRWCAAHADLWAKDGAHAAGLWRFPDVLYGDIVDFRPPMPVSAAEMRQWAKSTADLLRLGFGAMDEKEARRWSTPPSL